jgi:hypothetical protein
MTRPWQHPPEAQTVAVVHALQDLLCATEPSELRTVLGGPRAGAGAVGVRPALGYRVTVATAGRAAQRRVHPPRIWTSQHAA